MLDLSCVKKRYFGVKFCGRRLDVEPPKLKTMNRLVQIVKSAQGGDPGTIAELTPLIASLMSKNKQKYCVPPEKVAQELDFDEMMAFVLGLFRWLAQEKKDPN